MSSPGVTFCSRVEFVDGGCRAWNRVERPLLLGRWGRTLAHAPEGEGGDRQGDGAGKGKEAEGADEADQAGRGQGALAVCFEPPGGGSPAGICLCSAGAG